MNQFNLNISNLFGEKGKTWLANLPSIVDTLKTYWELSALKPVDNMSYNYVTKALSKNNQGVVLKISCDKTIYNEEIKALNFFAGRGSVSLLDCYDRYHAILLQQAVPGTTLKSLYPSKVEFVMDCYIETMRALHHQSLPEKHTFRHISDWLQAIERNERALKPELKQLLVHAKQIKNELLASPSNEIVLHGDLHHDNILQHGNHWIAIDPKGIIGESEFEIAAFDFIAEVEIKNKVDVQQLFQTRVAKIASKANLSCKRISNWVLVRLVLAASWFVEDGGDPTATIDLAHKLFCRQ